MTTSLLTAVVVAVVGDGGDADDEDPLLGSVAAAYACEVEGDCQVLCSRGNVDNDGEEGHRRHHLRLHTDDGNDGGPGSHSTPAAAVGDGCDGLVHYYPIDERDPRFLYG